MKRKIGIYEKALVPGPLSRMFEDGAGLGYDFFELSIDESDLRLERLDWEPGKRKEIVKSSRDAGIGLFSMCFSGQRRFPMGSADPETEKKSLEIMEKAVGLAYDLGIRVIQVAGYDVFYEPHSEETGKRFEENLIRSVRLAEQYGIMLSIETVEKYVTSVKKAVEIVEKVNSPWLTVYPDVANLYMMGYSPEDELKLGAGHMTAVHMRDVPDDDYLPFGEGGIDFEKVFSVLDDSGFCGPLVVELWSSQYEDTGKALLQARTFLEEKMNAKPAVSPLHMRRPQEEKRGGGKPYV